MILYREILDVCKLFHFNILTGFLWLPVSIFSLFLSLPLSINQLAFDNGLARECLCVFTVCIVITIIFVFCITRRHALGIIIFFVVSLENI